MSTLQIENPKLDQGICGVIICNAGRSVTGCILSGPQLDLAQGGSGITQISFYYEKLSLRYILESNISLLII